MGMLYYSADCLSLFPFLLESFYMSDASHPLSDYRLLFLFPFRCVPVSLLLRPANLLFCTYVLSKVLSVMSVMTPVPVNSVVRVWCIRYLCLLICSICMSL